MSHLRIASLLLLVACAGVVEAQNVRPAHTVTSFSALDQDLDGAVTRDEMMMWAQAADRNRDGKLSPEEFASAHVPPKDAHAARLKSREIARDQRISAKFAAADRNGDGVWDRPEIVAESRRHFELVEAAVNNDKSKKLRHEIKLRGSIATEADYLAHNTIVIAVADTNKDGRITAAEYMKWTKDGVK